MFYELGANQYHQMLPIFHGGTKVALLLKTLKECRARQRCILKTNKTD